MRQKFLITDYNIIIVDPSKLNRSSETAASFLHEVSHDVLANELLQPSSEKANRSKKNIEQAFEYYKLNSKGEYGFTNVHEFVAEAISNPEFQSTLKRIDSNSNKKKSLWQSLVSALKNLLGLTPSYDKVMQNILELSKGADSTTKVTSKVFNIKRIQDNSPDIVHNNLSELLGKDLTKTDIKKLPGDYVNLMSRNNVRS